MTGFERLLHLFAVGVVFHVRLLCLTVVQNGAVGSYPCYAAAGNVHIVKVALAGGLNTLCGEVGLHVELIHLLV